MADLEPLSLYMNPAASNVLFFKISLAGITEKKNKQILRACFLWMVFVFTMKTNLLNWCNKVTISKNVVFYASLAVRIC